VATETTRPQPPRASIEHADDMTLEKVQGAGHFLPEEVPELVRERVLDFL
jgi:pimeloyl-ACP methyl ester carboxylesterase